MIVLLNFVNAGCQSNENDATIKAAVENQLEEGNAMINNSSVDVKNGVVTLSGECTNDSCKKSYEEMIKNIAGVKSLVDNCTINMNMKMNPKMPMMNKQNPMKN